MADRDPYETWLRDQEQNDDNNDRARTLFESGLFPDGCPRLEALFRRAMRGNGVYSQRLQAVFGDLA
jgi:hypothetical protein